MNSNSTQPYKIIQILLVTLASFVIIGVTFFMKNDPYAQDQVLTAQIKQWLYSIAFAADAAFQNSSATAYDKHSGYDSSLSVPVLVYHGVLTHPDGSTINVTEQQFKDQMFALKKAGYHSITLDQLYAFGTRSETLPENPVAITFDDGRSDSYLNGDPILGALGYSANIFVITSFASAAKRGEYYLTPDELVLMKNTGRWSIGSHSANGHETYPVDSKGSQGHFFSNLLWLSDKNRLETNAEFVDRITKDFQTSQTYLQDLLGTQVTGFAFPFGDLGQTESSSPGLSKEVIAAASREYHMLFYQYRPGNYYSQFTPPDTDTKTLLIHRIDMSGAITGGDLLTMLRNGSQKVLPYVDTFSSDNGWLNVWGQHRIANGTLSMQASKDQSGAATIIDGSQTWKDYAVDVTLSSPNQTGVYVWTRFLDDNNNAGCNFGTNFVHVEEIVNGQKNVLRGVVMENVIPKGQFTITASVTGKTLSCSINGKVIVKSDFLDESLTHGGSGIKIWDQTLGKSAVTVTQFSAQPIKAAP